VVYSSQPIVTQLPCAVIAFPTGIQCQQLNRYKYTPSWLVLLIALITPELSQGDPHIHDWNQWESHSSLLQSLLWVFVTINIEPTILHAVACSVVICLIMVNIPGARIGNGVCNYMMGATMASSILDSNMTFGGDPSRVRQAACVSVAIHTVLCVDIKHHTEGNWMVVRGE